MSEDRFETETRWIAEVDSVLRRDWCIGVVDAGLSAGDLRRYWMQGESPAQFVAWFAEKYDLIRYEPKPYFPTRRP